MTKIEKSESDKALVRKMAASYAAMNAPKPKPEDSRPGPVPASVDEHGVSAEMRALLKARG